MPPRLHPLGLTSHPDWDGVWSRYIDLSEGVEPEDNAPLEPAADEREPTNAPIFLGAMAVLIVGLSLVASIA